MRWSLLSGAHLVINQFIEILDEDVALSGLAEGGVSLRPHDTAMGGDTSSNISDMKILQDRPNSPGAAFDERVVKLLQGALT